MIRQLHTHNQIFVRSTEILAALTAYYSAAENGGSLKSPFHRLPCSHEGLIEVARSSRAEHLLMTCHHQELPSAEVRCLAQDGIHSAGHPYMARFSDTDGAISYKQYDCRDPAGLMQLEVCRS